MPWKPTPEPTPNPPVPVPTPGKVSAAILLYESENTTQEIQATILKLRELKIKHLRVLDSQATQADSDEPLKIVVDALKFLGGKKLPRLIGLDSAGCSVVDADVKTSDDAIRLLASWGLQ